MAGQSDQNTYIVRTGGTRCHDNDKKEKTGGVGQVEMPHDFFEDEEGCLCVEPEYSFVVKKTSSRRSKSSKVVQAAVDVVI